MPFRDVVPESPVEPSQKQQICRRCARGITAIAILMLALGPVVSGAGVREDQRACHLGYLKTLKRGAPPPRPTNPDEQYCLGLAYWFQPSPVSRDPSRAAQWYEMAAKQGHVGAMVALAYQYEKGHGVEADAGKAFDLYRRAAEQGSPDAMFNVFRLYTTGKGVKADAQQAKQWLDKAAAAGSIDAKKELMKTARGTYQRPGQDMENAAFAAFTKKDYATSVRLYRQAGDLGNTAATVALGRHYHQGLGVAKDPKEAARLFRVAAEQGDAAGQAQLGLAYENGEGVTENWEEMRHWCEQSARQFHPLGLNCMGRLFHFGMAVPMDRGKAIALYDKSADQNDAYARWFSLYLRKPNCIGYRNEWEREKFFGMCLEPKEITFKNSTERTGWLRARYNEMEAEVLRDWGKNAGGQVCINAGGEWSGVSCYTPAGRPFDPTQGRAN